MASRRRVLIVVSSYRPAMLADMHRARHLAWELPNLGWDVEILAPDASYQLASCIEEDSSTFFSPLVNVTSAAPSLPRLFRALGVRTIGWRALVPMLLTGKRILPEGVDLIYFSTTQFCLFLLGPLWQFWYRVPYVFDFHDPLVKEDAGRPSWMKFNLRYPVARWLLNAVEKVAVPRAAALVSVSPQYLGPLFRRYGPAQPHWTKPDMTVVIPFGVLERDLIEASRAKAHRRFRPRRSVRIIYVGAGGPIMRRAFSLFCATLRALRCQQPSLVGSVQVELYGTYLGWREGDPRHLADVAIENGVGDLVVESPGRVSYRRSLELLLDSDGALILGVDDAGYMPSKLYPYAYSSRPLLAVLRWGGSAFAAVQALQESVRCLWFDGSTAMPLPDAVAMLRTFLEEAIARRSVDRREALQPFTASAMASRHARLFDRVVLLKAIRATRPVIDPAPAD